MKNPFRPTFGASPYYWAGRRVILDEFARAIDGYPGDPTRSLIIDGARGIGKTVLLTELEDIAAQQGWIVLRATGRHDMIRTLVESTIPMKIRELAPPPGRKVTGVSITGLGSVDTELTPGVDPTPTLSSRLRDLLGLLSGAGVLITVDEVQDADPDNLSHLAVAYQDLIRDNLEVSLAMAGLTHGVNRLLDLPGTTFLRRARRFELGPLTDDDARATLLATAEGSGRPFDNAGVDAAVHLAQGYPYLVQLVGYLAWSSSGGTITAEDVSVVRQDAVLTMGSQVHAPSLKGVPPAQIAYLRAVADLIGDEESVSSSAVAEAVGKRPNEATDTRGKLLDRGLIESPSWGQVSFTLPYLAEFLRSNRRVTRVN
ncbi:Mitochondrial ribosomal death-associated protein 3 [Corynebacterium atrinae]|uniref:ATP-binding protein n=1 Tax=Corynebacterium atrinae TaxID=1336740 RepID=UPI0025B54C57|nr:ATP-binding protein [Corynebacterium atrinae]WJY63667.1 Mitochondrial ribosomal death-associated protein 3 [Corynebacterium atrinae]